MVFDTLIVKTGLQLQQCTRLSHQMRYRMTENKIILPSCPSQPQTQNPALSEAKVFILSIDPATHPLFHPLALA